MDDTFKVQDLAVYLKVSHRTITRLAQKGLIPAFRVGKLWRFHSGEIQEWVKRISRKEMLKDNL